MMCIRLCVLIVLMRAWFFCSYTHIHRTFLYNTILMEMLFFQNESCYRRSE